MFGWEVKGKESGYDSLMARGCVVSKVNRSEYKSRNYKINERNNNTNKFRVDIRDLGIQTRNMDEINLIPLEK